MSTTLPTTKEKLNQAPPNQLADFLRGLGLGAMIRALPTWLRKKTSVAGAPATNYQLATVAVLALPNDAKAASIVRCTTRTASAGAGEQAPQTYGTTPATTQCAVAPNGDIVFVVGDLPTDVDVLYIPEKGEVVELFLPCTASVATIPSQYTARGVSLLLEAEAVAGSVAGKKAILVPGAGGPATLQARLNIAKTTVTFNNGTDAVTQCRVKLLVGPTGAMGSASVTNADQVDVDASLAANSPF